MKKLRDRIIKVLNNKAPKDDDSITMSKLAAILYLPESPVRKSVNKLVKEGIVEKGEKQTDAKSIRHYIKRIRDNQRKTSAMKALLQETGSINVVKSSAMKSLLEENINASDSGS